MKTQPEDWTMKAKAIATIALLGAATLPVAAGEQLTGEALKEALVGNTVYGTYMRAGTTQKTEFVEFMSDDGNIVSKEQGVRYVATYEIDADGCVNIDYGSRYDGCLRYEYTSGDKYIVATPYGQNLSVTIVKGDPENLGSDAPPEVVDASSEGITLKKLAGGSVGGIYELAKQHCLEHGKKSILLSSSLPSYTFKCG